MIAFTCVGCGQSFQAPDDLAGRLTRCKQCGGVTRIPAAVLAPLPAAPRPSPSPAPEVNPRRSRPRRKKSKTSNRDAWVSLAIGAGIAVVALMIPPAVFVVHVLMTVIHELGHTATAWLFGSPALPSFDLSYGGGVSHISVQQPILMILIYAGFAFLAFRERDDQPRLIAILVGVGLYSVAAFSPLRELLILAMGHGSELLFAGVFLYRAISGSEILRSEERPLYAFIGLFIVLYDALFAYHLIASPGHREDYGDAKGGGHQMDFSLIANEHLHVRLETVAAFFLVACALPPVVAFLVRLYRRRTA
ncbi:MAG: hypothetical protein ACLQGP_04075 [Isosphaeraceae bacterium]